MFSFFKKSPVFHSSINGDITIKKRYGQEAVLTGKITQSGGELVRMWEQVFKQEKVRKTTVKSVLILGVGGGSAFRIIHDNFSKATFVGVEIDPVMIKIAKEFFDLRTGLRVKVYEDDAIKWVDKKRKEKFDLILIDLYIKELNPKGARDQHFLSQVKEMSSPQGIVFFNAHYTAKNPKEYEKFLKMCKVLYINVEEVYSYPLNRILRLSGKLK